VAEFEISRPHRELTIDVRARVGTQVPEPPPLASWETLATDRYREAAGEFLMQTDDAPGHPVLGELIEATSHTPDPVALVHLVAGLIPDRFAYRPGVTYVDSSISDLLDVGAGVCQDFVHLGLHLLRAHGVAARYVSGYLYSSDQDDADRSAELDTHAWLEALIPSGDPDPEHVWVGMDPTNRILASENHVKIGHGRHYADVPPIKGVYRGMATSAIEASVTMTRLDGPDPAATART
jgi:transglutaminase-like putative cysteine protease